MKDAAKEGDHIVAIDTHLVLGVPTPVPFDGVLDDELSPDVLAEHKYVAFVGSTATNTPVHVAPTGSFDRTRASFTKEPIVCVWGCHADDAVLRILDEIAAKDARGEPYEETVAKVRGQLTNSFASHLARTLDRRVLGALPGMGAAHEGEPNDDPVPFRLHPTAMHVHFGLHKRDMELYDEHLGTKFANTGAFAGNSTFGRGYAYFDP